MVKIPPNLTLAQIAGKDSWLSSYYMKVLNQGCQQLRNLYFEEMFYLKNVRLWLIPLHHLSSVLLYACWEKVKQASQAFQDI